MAATLDHKRPYGTIHGGSGANRARFEQDGKEFDGSGREIVRVTVAKAPAAPSETATDKTTAVNVAKDAQGNLFLNGEILDTEDMTVEAVRALAKDMGLDLHKLIGKPKALAAIMAAAGPVDQLAAQLGD